MSPRDPDEGPAAPSTETVRPGVGQAVCELTVARPDGPTRQGAGTGASLEDALRIATERACAAFDQPACDAARGFRVRTTRQNTRFTMNQGGSSAEAEVEVELVRVRTVSAHAAGPTRTAACRAAIREACGAPTCPEGTSLEELDGAHIAP